MRAGIFTVFAVLLIALFQAGCSSPLGVDTDRVRENEDTIIVKGPKLTAPKAVRLTLFDLSTMTPVSANALQVSHDIVIDTGRMSPVVMIRSFHVESGSPAFNDEAGFDLTCDSLFLNAPLTYIYGGPGTPPAGAQVTMGIWENGGVYRTEVVPADGINNQAYVSAAVGSLERTINVMFAASFLDSRQSLPTLFVAYIEIDY